MREPWRQQQQQRERVRERTRERETRPSRSVLQKHALMLLAAPPPCQLNGWASDSGLYIPTVLLL